MSTIRRINLCGALAVLACVGCGEVSVSEELQPGQPALPELPFDILEKIRDGQVTDDRPEVGRIGGCTATLVASDIAITAAHCVGYRSRTSPGAYMTMRLFNGGETLRITVNRYRSFGNGLGEHDIALLGLAEQVPPSFARPAPIARLQPEAGTSLTVFGYGCTRIGYSGDGKKRKATYEQGERAYHLCPGDSGGPVFNDETGEVLRINSGYRTDNRRTDIYGQVPSEYGDLKAQIEAWTQGEVPEADPLDPDVEICGRNVEVYELWTCTESRAYRYRCLPGGGPTWQICDLGCKSQGAGQDDACKLDEVEDTCGDTYRSYTDWICATDNLTLLRCKNNTLELSRCALGCDYAPGTPDSCKE